MQTLGLRPGRVVVRQHAPVADGRFGAAQAKLFQHVPGAGRVLTPQRADIKARLQAVVPIAQHRAHAQAALGRQFQGRAGFARDQHVLQHQQRRPQPPGRSLGAIPGGADEAVQVHLAVVDGGIDALAGQLDQHRPRRGPG